MPDRRKQALTGLGGSPGPNEPSQQGGESERDHRLQPDKQERVVVGAARGKRRDMEGPVDARRQATPDDLGDEDEKHKRRSAPAAKHGQRFYARTGACAPTDSRS